MMLKTCKLRLIGYIKYMDEPGHSFISECVAHLKAMVLFMVFVLPLTEEASDVYQFHG